MKIYDLHTHSVFSDGEADIGFLKEKAAEKGYGLGVADHIYCGQLDTENEMKKYLNALDEYGVLKGVEANIGTDFTLPDRILSRLDYLIASVHSVQDRDGSIIRLSKYFACRAGHIPAYTKTFSSKDSGFLLEESLRQIENSLKRFPVDILGHATVTPFYEDMAGTWVQTRFEDEMLSLCKKHGVALEISGLWKSPSLEVVMKARKLGMKFSFGCDCHKLREVCDLEYALRLIEEAGITENELFMPKNFRG
jgi:histidinol phosphatase-like PHP family hydrolase